MQSSMSALSGEQIRAARALTRIDQADLARRSGLSLETIKRLERIRGPVDANSRTLRALFEVFAAMGVAFDTCEEGGVGVRLSAGKASRTALETARPTASLRQMDQAPADTAGHRLIYFSTANRENSPPLHELLEQIKTYGKRRKATLDVTGILYAQDGRFLSVLEGTRDHVRQVFGAIASDRRHSSLSIISDRPAPVRYFPDWSVCCGRFQSDAEIVGDEPSLRKGFNPEGLSPASALGLLNIMRDLQEASPRNHLGSRCPCPLAGTCLDRACAEGAAISTSPGPPRAGM